MKKLVLIDGHSLAFRAFYALPISMQTASGLYTNAAYGFTSMLQKIIEEIKPDYLVVAFDKGKVTFRNKLYQEYKGTRSSMPDELREQIGYIEDVLTAYGIKQIAIDDYEADDIIGTIAARAEEKGNIETIIITGDRDSYQLVAPHTTVYYTRKGISDILQMDMDLLQETYGVSPQQMIDVKALMGDKSDNIPGVPGVGEKTALKLIAEYQSLPEVFNNIDKISGKALTIRLTENKDLAFLSYKLAKIDCQIPVKFDWEEIALGNPNYQKLYEVFTRLEFNRFLSNVKPEQAEEEIADIKVTTVETKQQSTDLLAKLTEQAELFFYLDAPKRCIYIIHNKQLFVLSESVWRSTHWQSLWEDKQCHKITHEIKTVWHVFNECGIDLRGVVFDTDLAAYVLDPTASQYDLTKLITQYLSGTTTMSVESLLNSLPHQVVEIPNLYKAMFKQIDEQQLNELYCEVELPLAIVLAKMEKSGVAIDKTVLEGMSEELEASLNQVQEQIYAIAGEEFNINSPKQLSVIMFEKLNLPILKKTKTGYSTSHEVLETLAAEHDLPAMIIHYRQLAKLKSTYIDGILPLIAEDGRLHTTFQQTITATGRLSSTEPNLQNIPIRMEEGRRIRRAFVPGDEYDYLLAADYSQIELRILAHMSNDEILQEAFNNDEDIHTRTAAEVFGVELGNVSKEMRYRAKAVNFGIVYGISDYGLARDLKITRKEAGTYIENYFARYQGVRAYLDDTIIEAKSKGYVETMLKRRRYLPEINSRSFHRRSFAERTATNTPIQGSAADLIKLAMVRLDEKLVAGNYQSKLLLQVHDELILEVTKEELHSVAELLETTMKDAMQLAVPIKVDVKMGTNWYEMEELQCRNCQK